MAKTFNFILIISLTLGQVTSPLVINEINYHSSDTFIPGDWIELYNASGENIELNGWMVKDQNDDHIFTISDQYELANGEYMVICRDSAAFQLYFPEVENFLGGFPFGFSAAGEIVRLFNADTTLIDTVHFDDAPPWPVEADGSGSTLELIDPALDNALPEFWQASLGYGTPGMENSSGIEVALGDLNGDGGWNVLDIVTLTNCILGDNCPQLEFGYAGDLNGDGIYNVLDIVTLANCVLAQNCGG